MPRRNRHWLVYYCCYTYETMKYNKHFYTYFRKTGWISRTMTYFVLSGINAPRSVYMVASKQQVFPVANTYVYMHIDKWEHLWNTLKSSILLVFMMINGVFLFHFSMALDYFQSRFISLLMIILSFFHPITALFRVKDGNVYEIC